MPFSEVFGLLFSGFSKVCRNPHPDILSFIS